MLSVSSRDLRKINRESVLKSIARAGAASRLQLAGSTGLTTAAISRITRQLIDVGLLQEIPDSTGTGNRGRRTQPLQLAPNGAWIIAMVISANRRSVAIANSCGKVQASVELESVNLGQADKALRIFATAANDLIEQSQVNRKRILGVSIVVAALTKPANDGRITSPILEWDDIPVAHEIARMTNLPVHLETRAVALLQSELWCQPANDNKSVILVNNGWRMGSSASLNGKLLETGEGRLGQLSHYAIPSNPTTCYCGQSGCLDALASGAALVDAIEKKHRGLIGHNLSLNQKLDAAIKLAATRRSVAAEFHRAGKFLGYGLNALASLFAAEQIFLAGATCRQPDYFEGVKKSFTFSAPADKQIETSTHCAVSLCSISSIDAAIRTGLDAFLFCDSLDLQQFKPSAMRA
ncbi:hypothetical protein AB833_17950 [Chromatiales bacterium (ex Bugula neritina AB1)]|nr:hypothetical protein AB833_17950 [Chromatiales bacterium (ex Bugula neritina AB1)]